MKKILRILSIIFVLSLFLFTKDVNAFGYIISDTSTLKSGGGNSVLVTDKSYSWPSLTWQAQNAQWIWNVADLSKEKAISGETEIFSKSFSLSEVPTSAKIYYYYDNFIAISVNGTKVVDSLSGDPYDGFQKEHSKDIKSYLKVGDNTIIFTARNSGASVPAWQANKAGFIYYIDIDPNLVDPAIDPYIPPAFPSGSISVNSDCKITVNNNTCNVKLTWTTKDLIAGQDTAVTTNNPNPNTKISSNTSGANVSHNAYYGDSGLYLYHAGSLLDSTSVSATCISGTIWNGSKCVKDTTGTLDGNDCEIQTGESSCVTDLTLSITNPVVTAETNITKAGNIEVASGITPATKTGITVSYPGTTFYLNHNSLTLNNKTIQASCVGGTTWEDGICKEVTLPPPPVIDPPITDPTPLPEIIFPRYKEN